MNRVWADASATRNMVAAKRAKRLHWNIGDRRMVVLPG
jgi:hypothetical protein